MHVPPFADKTVKAQTITDCKVCTSDCYCCHTQNQHQKFLYLFYSWVLNKQGEGETKGLKMVWHNNNNQGLEPLGGG